MSNIVNREFDLGTMRPLKNTEGQVMDKYIPRKCSITSKVIAPNDYASVQIFVPDVDENGHVRRDAGSGFKFAISGYLRNKGRSNYEIEKLLRSKNIFPLKD